MRHPSSILSCSEEKILSATRTCMHKLGDAQNVKRVLGNWSGKEDNAHHSVPSRALM